VRDHHSHERARGTESFLGRNGDPGAGPDRLGAFERDGPKRGGAFDQDVGVTRRRIGLSTELFHDRGGEGAISGPQFHDAEGPVRHEPIADLLHAPGQRPPEQRMDVRSGVEIS